MEELMGPKEQTHIVKGKRTKRQRLNSLIPFTIIATSSIARDNANDENALNTDSSLEEDEEEEMANCLILLAQGRGHFQDFTEPFRFSSKRYIEKMGIYVYDCKTCGRAFSSFQALGGHRASHTKPKGEDNKKNNNYIVLPDDDFESNSLSFQLSNNKVVFGSTNKFKVHECSICGSEFSSGQALGGHMRRHRGPISINTTLFLSHSNPIKIDSEEAKQQNNALSSDLNLPTPDELGFASKHQKPPLVLSTSPTLVDCHY